MTTISNIQGQTPDVGNGKDGNDLFTPPFSQFASVPDTYTPFKRNASETPSSPNFFSPLWHGFLRLIGLERRSIDNPLFGMPGGSQISQDKGLLSRDLANFDTVLPDKLGTNPFQSKDGLLSNNPLDMRTKP